MNIKRRIVTFAHKDRIADLVERINLILETRMYNNLIMPTMLEKCLARFHGDLKEYGLSDVKIDKIIADHVNHYEKFRKTVKKHNEALYEVRKSTNQLLSKYKNLPIGKYFSKVEDSVECYNDIIDRIVEENDKLVLNLFK